MDNRIKKNTGKISVSAVLAVFLSLGGFAFFVISFTEGFHNGVRLAAGISGLALLLSIIVFVYVAASQKKLRGLGFAVAAIAMSLPAVVFVVGADSTARRRAETEKTRTGIYNLRILGKAVHKYAEEHGGRLPLADEWCDLLMASDKNLSRDNFKHPLLKEWECNYAFNKQISGLPIAKVHNNTVLIFEADGKWNLNGGAELLKPRLNDSVNVQYIKVLLVDGSIETYWFAHNGINTYGDVFVPLRWNP